MSIIEVAFITVPAVAVASAVYIADRLSHAAGRHVITPQRSHAASRDPFAGPADRDDPHGEKYAAWAARTAAEAWRPDPGPLAEIVRALPAAGPLPELPPDPPPDATGVLNLGITWLGTPVDQYVDELFAKHAEAQP